MGQLSIIGLKVQTSITHSGRMWIPRYFAGVDEDRCRACGLCIKVCPRGILGVDLKVKGSIPTMLDKDSCIGCSACMKICKNRAVFCNPKKL